MKFSKQTLSLLKQFQVDPVRGFLPATDPVLKLSPAYQIWDDYAAELTDFIKAGAVRSFLLNMPLIENPNFKSSAEWERAMLLLSCFAHAYVNTPPEKADHLPPSISIPWVKVAKHLGRVPIITHASLVLNNWRRLAPEQPIQMDNLAMVAQFYGGLDESWFYLVTVNIEKIGGPAIPLLLESMQDLAVGQFEKAIERLQNVAGIILAMTAALKEMYLNCDPAIFYQRIRPFIDSFSKVDYQGTDLGRQSFHGGSAAQSSLIQSLDAFIGHRYKAIPDTNNYLLEMRNYMPAKHADFLRFIETQTSLKGYTEQYPALKLVYDEIVENLIAFRNEHLKMVSIYIMKQARANQSNAVGTGGTNPMVFLKSIRNKNQDDW